MAENTFLWFLVVNVFIHGIVAGLSFDTVLVKLPARKRIGATGYADFARANDLGNGLIVYPALGILTVILVFGTTAYAWVMDKPSSIMNLLFIASFLTVAHSLCTAKAAPVMLSLREKSYNKAVIENKLNTFAYWSMFRALFQIGVFAVLIWTLTESNI